MENILRSVIIMSIGGSITALVLLAVKPLIRYRITKSFQYYIWLIVLFQLLVPLTISLPIPTQEDQIPTVSNIVDQYMVSFGNELDKSSQINTTSGFSNETVKQIPQPSGQSVRFFTFIMWLAGVIVFLLVNLFGYFRFRNFISKAIIPTNANDLLVFQNLGKRPQLFRSEVVKTPMLIGLFHAIIVLPEQEYTEIQLRNILTHEMVHYNRKDILIKWLVLFANAIHWFNPMVYFVRHEVHRACELSCDEAVVTKLTLTEKQAYGNTLLDLASDSKFLAGRLSVTMCEEKKNLRERLLAIMNYNRKSKWMFALSTVLLLAVCGIAMVACADVATITTVNETTQTPHDTVNTAYEESSDNSVISIADSESVSGSAPNFTDLGTEPGMVTEPKIVDGSIIRIVDFETGDSCSLYIEVLALTGKMDENSGAAQYEVVRNTKLLLPADVLVTYIDYESSTGTNGEKLISYLSQGGSYFPEATIAKLIVHTDEGGNNITELTEVYEP